MGFDPVVEEEEGKRGNWLTWERVYNSCWERLASKSNYRFYYFIDHRVKQ